MSEPTPTRPSLGASYLEESRAMARATIDQLAPNALGAAGAPRVDTSLIERALAIADDAARHEVESYCRWCGNHSYRLTRLDSELALSPTEADADTLMRVHYLVDRGLAAVHTETDGCTRITLLVHRFAPMPPNAEPAP